MDLAKELSTMNPSQHMIQFYHLHIGIKLTLLSRHQQNAHPFRSRSTQDLKKEKGYWQSEITRLICMLFLFYWPLNESINNHIMQKWRMKCKLLRWKSDIWLVGRITKITKNDQAWIRIFLIDQFMHVLLLYST